MTTLLYNQPNCVALLFDPEGGHHPCVELGEPYGDGKRYWAAGLVGPSPEWIVDRIHAQWEHDPEGPDPESDYRASIACFGDRP